MHERIRYLRKEILKLTQQEFSDSLKISRSNMGNIEIGRIAVTDRVIYDICEKFNVNEEWLRAGSGDIFIELSVDEQIAEFIAHVLKDKEESFKKRYISMLSKFAFFIVTPLVGNELNEKFIYNLLFLFI